MAEKDKYKDPNSMGKTSTEGLAAGAVNYANAMRMADSNAEALRTPTATPAAPAQADATQPQTVATAPTKQTSYNEAIEPSRFDWLREQSATDLLNANIQTQMAKAAARRNLQNTLAAQGLDNSGYYGTGMAQLESNAMAQRQRNLATYQQAIRGIQAQENEQAEQTKAASLENLTNAIQRASSKEQIDRWLNAYGIEVVDGEPQGPLFDGLNAETKSYIKGILSDSYENAAKAGIASYASANDLKGSDIRTYTNNKLTGNGGVEQEIDYLYGSAVGQNLAKEGNVVHLQNNNGKDGVYLKYINGGWATTTKDEYDKNGVLIRGNLAMKKYDGTPKNPDGYIKLADGWYKVIS